MKDQNSEKYSYSDNEHRHKHEKKTYKLTHTRIYFIYSIHTVYQ